MPTPTAGEPPASSGDRAPEHVAVAFRFHARALAALGRDLVTNDIVAVMELVKNSYDALASSVTVRVWSSSQDGRVPCLQVDDDGHGMDYATIRDVWCVIATPFRRERPVSRMGSLTRSVTGEKGLGRLATARLGRTLDVITKTEGGPVLHFTVDWDNLVKARDLGNAGFEVSELPADALHAEHGTRVSVTGLRTDWNDAKVDELRRHLARLVSPFGHASDFSLRVQIEDGQGPSDARPIEPPAFMSRPKYAIEGNVDETGHITGVYRYRPIQEGDGREHSIHDTWAPVQASASGPQRLQFEQAVPACGPFRFEIRAWDLTQDDTRDIAEHFPRGPELRPRRHQVPSGCFPLP